MASVRKLAARAAELKRTNPDLSMPAAARQAVAGQGITHRPDQDRLVREIIALNSKKGGTKMQSDARFAAEMGTVRRLQLKHRFKQDAVASWKK